MRVLLIGMGGVNAVFKNSTESSLARGLTQRGHTVYSYSYLDPKWPVQQLRDEDVEGVHVHRVRLGPLGFSTDLWRAMARDPLPDIVNIHHLRNELLWQALLFFQRRRVPVVLTPIGVLHNRFLTDNRDDPFSYPIKYDNLIFGPRDYLQHLSREFRPRKHMRNWLTHFPMKQPDHFIALTHFEKDLLVRLGFPEDRISIIPHSIDLDFVDRVLQENRAPADFNFPRPIVLFIGQLKFRKGFDLLIRAAPLVRQTFPTASFVFVTYNLSQRDAFMQIVKQAGAGDYVYLVKQSGGPETEAEKLRQYAASNVYVLPTRYEGFPIPVMEAMACRVPVVSTDIPVIHEQIDEGWNGLIANRNDPEDLARKIVEMLQDPALQKRCAANGRERVETCWTDPIIAERTEAVYLKVLEERKRVAGRGERIVSG